MVTRETKKYAVISSLVFVAGVVTAAATYYYVSLKGDELSVQAEVLGKNEQLAQQHEQLLESLEAYEDEHAQLAGYLLTESETINFLNDLETFARGTGLVYSTDALKVEPLPNSQFKAIELQLRAEGAEQRVIDFLTLLETLPYYSRISALSLESQSRDGGQWLARVTLVVGLREYD